MRLAIVFICLLLATPSMAAPFESVLKSATPGKKYFFYIHGETMEKQGRNASSPRYGVYRYDDIVRHFEDRGLVVVEEVRGKTNANRYAAKIVMQIRQLEARGVPGSNITVAGFSRGGHIALLVASSLGDPSVGYVIMAGCGRNTKAFEYEQFLKRKRGSRLRGRILSIYASSDMEAGSCRRAVSQAPGNGVAFRERVIKSGKGHGLFFQPRPEWITPAALFATGGR